VWCKEIGTVDLVFMSTHSELLPVPQLNSIHRVMIAEKSSA
jgi:hypothetical protein